ncbi:MAG: hypothetical protein JO290_11300 [Sphingomonadaceae bacterium]|nr:hypothetical protein [Sphingomonadaceae bacterium]
MNNKLCLLLTGLQISVYAASVILVAGQGEQAYATANTHVYKQQAVKTVTSKQPEPPAPVLPQRQCYPGSPTGISCDGISAKAAVDQAGDADKQVALLWPQFGVSFATLVAAFAAAAYARNAVVEAKRNADIARDSDRAWIVFDAIEGRRSIGTDGLTHGVNIWTKFINAGNSPALEVLCFLQIEYVTDESLIDNYQFSPIDNRKSGHSVVGPGRSIGPGYGSIDKTTYTDLYYKKSFAVIRSGAKYTDFHTKQARVIDIYFRFVPIHPPDKLFSEGDAPFYTQFMGMGDRSRAT